MSVVSFWGIALVACAIVFLGVILGGVYVAMRKEEKP